MLAFLQHHAAGLLFALVSGVVDSGDDLFDWAAPHQRRQGANPVLCLLRHRDFLGSRCRLFGEPADAVYLLRDPVALHLSARTHNQDDEAIKGGRKYLIYLLTTSVGLALPAMIIAYQQDRHAGLYGSGVFQETSTTMLTVLLVMFCTACKAGLMPFHAWLPGAMVAPAPVSALLHAVAVVKVGVFFLLRVLTGIFGVDRLANAPSPTIICILADSSSWRRSSLTQDNLKARFAYSTVGQLSYIILGVGFASESEPPGASHPHACGWQDHLVPLRRGNHEVYGAKYNAGPASGEKFRSP